MKSLLLQGRLDFLYAFQNEKKIFVAADHRYKQSRRDRHQGGGRDADLCSLASRIPDHGQWVDSACSGPWRFLPDIADSGVTSYAWDSRRRTCGPTARRR